MDMSMPAHEGGNALVETDYIVNANRVCPIYVARWLKDIPGTSPDVNPLYRQPAELEGLNPQLILVGAGEFALQESKDLAKLCNQAQVQHEIRCESGQLHVYALGSAWLDPAVRRRTDATVIDWMRSCLAQSHGQTNGVGQGKTKQSSLISA
jgi:acetyl esterase/lipase